MEVIMFIATSTGMIHCNLCKLAVDITAGYTVMRLKFLELMARARKSQCTHIDTTLNCTPQQHV